MHLIRDIDGAGVHVLGRVEEYAQIETSSIPGVGCSDADAWLEDVFLRRRCAVEIETCIQGVEFFETF